MKGIVVAFIFWFFYSNSLSQIRIDDTLRLVINSDENINSVLNPTIRYLLTPEILSPKQVNDLFKQNKGIILPTKLLNVEPLNNICWLNFELENADNDKIIFFKIERSDVHYFEAFKIYDEKIDTLILSGDGKPFYQRPIKIADLSFPIKLKPNEKATILVMMEKRGEELATNIIFQNEEEFYESNRNNYNFIFFYLGVITFMVVFNVFLWVNLKDKIHLIYLGIITANTFFVLSQSGVGFQYIWSNLLNKNSLFNTLFTTLQFSFVLFFMTAFLNLKGNSIFYYFAKYYAWVLLFVAILILFVPIDGSAFSVNLLISLRKLFYFLVAINLILLLIVIVEQIIKKNPYVYVYAISMSFLLCGGILYSLSIAGFDFWLRPSYIIFFGNLFELVILTYGLTVRYNNFKKSNSMLELSMSNLQRNLSLKIINAQETERNRIAQDLHDEVGNSLAALKNFVVNSNPDLSNKINKIAQDVRDISHNLASIDFEKTTLSTAFQNLIHRQNEAQTIVYELIEIGIPQNLSPDKSLVIYRIACELLNNIHKHSKAKKATVQLIFEPDTLALMVEDDGVGIQTKGNKIEGIGLNHIQTRVAYLNGKLTMDDDGKGTVIIINIPI
jgi:signal transduction histidine kinase